MNEEEKILPNVKKGLVEAYKFIDEQHFTQPPQDIQRQA